MPTSVRGTSPGGSGASSQRQGNEESKSPASSSASGDSSAHISSSLLTQQKKREEEIKHQHRPVSRGRVLLAILRNPENSSVLIKFLLFAILMAVLPISTVLVLPRLVLVMLKHMQSKSDDDGLRDAANMCGNIAAIVLVNVVMLSYAFLAYREEKRDWEKVCRAQASAGSPSEKEDEATATKKRK
ncbi:VMA21-like domain protein [Toxoplasma gondii VAND]|uniref:VMA21-like domain protein n=4 Tax=Toxoplasma gondii TaxID=5811 RepID=B9QP66_TOXGV|nr:VMA21-like domain protein [Toxoplasma gondii VEG]KFG29519.1 VMA21-like domain protein [Toxoplasma gondii p89]KFH01572.1 VMA21-like domain protein [Toxoplasma gondii VAND]PUA85397.1 VMA21-like domain protein [Toxoplasma gondii TgCATBr9]CEL75636.1 TPA: hypothetical protein BN1205_109410 [Toxoplasma gondii VEG]